MFDIGWSELFIIAVVALIVVGPKDLPVMFRTLGRFTAKARGMAREFQRAMESAADEAGVKDIQRDLKAATSTKSLGLDAIENAAKRFEAWDPMKKPTPPEPTARPTPDPSAPMGPATAALAAEQAARREAAEAKRVARVAALEAEAAPPPAEPTAKAVRKTARKVSAKVEATVDAAPKKPARPRKKAAAAVPPGEP